MSKTISIVAIIKDENGCEKSSKLIHESEVSIPEKIGDLGLTQSNQQEIVEKIQEVQPISWLFGTVSNKLST